MSPRKMVKLQGKAGKQLEVPALWLKDGLAVTNAWGEAGYALSHVRSGLLLARFELKSRAVRCGVQISQLAHWHDERPSNEPEVKRRIVALIESCGGAR